MIKSSLMPNFNIKKNAHAKLLIGIILIIVIYCILVHLLVVYESQSDQSAITTYSNAIWYTLVTLSTVGYGDLFPATTYGRAIGLIFVFASIGIFGLLIGKLSTLMSTIKENKKFGYTGTNFENHAVIIGWNEFGWHVVNQLVGVKKKVAIITDNKEHVDSIHEKYNSKDVFVLHNSDLSNTEALNKANINVASVAFINLENDTEKLVYVIDFKKVYPNIELVVSLENRNLKGTFMAAGVSSTISSQDISAMLLASYMFEPDVANFSESLLSYAKVENDYDIKQLRISEGSQYVNVDYHKAFLYLKKKYNIILIGISKTIEGKRHLIKNPKNPVKIEKDDYIIVILDKASYEQLGSELGVEEGVKFNRKGNA